MIARLPIQTTHRISVDFYQTRRLTHAAPLGEVFQYRHRLIFG